MRRFIKKPEETGRGMSGTYVAVLDLRSVTNSVRRTP